jgi:hypothetical protein
MGPRSPTPYPRPYTNYAIQASRLSCSYTETLEVMGTAGIAPCILNLGSAWLEAHIRSRTRKSPRGPVERGLVGPKDGLDMNRNLRCCRELNHCPDRNVLTILTALPTLTLLQYNNRNSFGHSNALLQQ